MSRECIICGRQLKTGRKYCYLCRGRKENKEMSLEEQERYYFTIKIISLCMAIIFFFIYYTSKSDWRSFAILIGLISLIVFFVSTIKLLNIKRKIKEKQEVLIND